MDFTHAIQQCMNESGMHASPGMRNAAETNSALSDLWTKLIAAGSTVNWTVVLQQFLPIIQKLISGTNVETVISWLMTLFAAVPKQPSVP